MSTVAMPATAPLRTWTERGAYLFRWRKLLTKTACISFAVSLGIACVWPKEYKSSTSIMPPNSNGGGAAMLAALTGRNLGGLSGLGSLAGGLLGVSSSTAMLVDLLHSGTINGDIADRFHLQEVYHKRYRVDTLKTLARRVSVQDDKKSGVITITVMDHDPRRARDMAAAYLDELNMMLNRTSTSSAHQERVFVEHRLKQAHVDLERAQEALSEFSSTHALIDLKEQARAEVNSGAALQAQILLEESNISSMRQIYADGTIELRTAQARASALRAQLSKIGGSSAPLGAGDQSAGIGDGAISAMSPSLRQLPRLAVPFTDRYREVQIQEKLFELLTEQFEMARISEARDIPVISVIDAPGIPEKKSFPPRAWMTLALFAMSMALVCWGLLLRARWQTLARLDPRRVLIDQILESLSWRKEQL